LDYAPFYDGNQVYLEHQEIFEKQMIEALDAGTVFCFLHYDESVPKYYQHGFDTGHIVVLP
jgi:hypothetical protein